MQDCLNQGAKYWSDTDPRYWSVEKFVQDHWGKISKQTLFAAESIDDYYVPEGWSRSYREDWGLDVWKHDQSQPVPSGWHNNWVPIFDNGLDMAGWYPQVH